MEGKDDDVGSPHVILLHCKTITAVAYDHEEQVSTRNEKCARTVFACYSEGKYAGNLLSGYIVFGKPGFKGLVQGPSGGSSDSTQCPPTCIGSSVKKHWAAFWQRPVLEDGAFDPSIPEEGPSAPPPGWLDHVSGYEDPNGGDCTHQICPPPPDFVPHPENDRNASVPNVMVPQVSEDVAREALLQFVGRKWTYSSKPAHNLVFKELKPFTVYRYRLETFTESRSSAWEYETYTGQFVDGPQFGVISPPWQVEVQYPPKFTDFVQKVRVPHTSTVKPCHQCQGKGRVRCTHCHGRGRSSCISCHGSGHGRNRRCAGCHGSGRRNCTWCHGSGHKTCRTCNGHKNLLHFIQLTVNWKNQVYEFIPDRQPEFPLKKFEKVSGEDFFIDENLLVYPIVGFPDQEICEASKRAAQEHLIKYSAVSRILQQRQTIELVPLTHAFYSYNGKDYDYFVYGTENKVHTSKYPASCTVL